MGKNLTVFLVEDDRVASEILCNSLRKKSNFKVFQFFLAEDALKAITEKFPDILIIDYQLPGMSGIELFEKIMSLKPPSSIIIMASAINDGALVLKFIQQGIRNYVIKDDKILESINEILSEEMPEPD